MPTTTIPVDTRVRDRLKTYGSMGSTYSQLLSRLMDEIDRERFIQEMRHRARTNKDWVRLEDL